MSNQQPTTNEQLPNFLTQPLKAVGKIIEPGSYPAVLRGFGNPFEMTGDFNGKKRTRMVFAGKFAIRLKDGTVSSQDFLMSTPDAGEIDKRSKLFRMLKTISKGRNLITSNDDFADGVGLATFIGLPAVVNLVNNAKGFIQVESVSAPIDGAKYPSHEELLALDEEEKKSQDEIPF